MDVQSVILFSGAMFLYVVKANEGFKYYKTFAILKHS